MQTDPIADFITVIRNAVLARHTEAVVPHSRLREAVGGILAREGFVERIEVFEERRRRRKYKHLRIYLRYYDELRSEGPLNHIARVSKPSRRVYADASGNQPLRGGVGVKILSTSSGVMTDSDARRKSVGGEVLMEVW
jgi:small subunit ribosomal protein S8